MEVTRAELSRIVGYQNPHCWSIDHHHRRRSSSTTSFATTSSVKDDGEEEHVETLEEHQYYFLDKDGCNIHGDSALHRLLALHASPSVVRNFVAHMKEHARRLQQIEETNRGGSDENGLVPRPGTSSSSSSSSLFLGRYNCLPTPPKIDQVNAKGVSALHVAVYRNSWHVDQIVQFLLQECRELASMAMRPCGSYPLHVLTGHNITIRKEVLDLLLQAEEEVRRSSSSRNGYNVDDNKIVWKEDAGGNNPLSLLWKNVLRFRWARQWEGEGVGPPPTPPPIATPSCPLTEKDMTRKRDLSWMTVITPGQFLDYSLTLLQAAYGRPYLNWHDVCGFPRCPPLLVRLLFHEQQREERQTGLWRENEQQRSFFVSGCRSLDRCIYSRDEQGRLPLHRAAEALAVNQNSLPSTFDGQFTPLVQLLLHFSQVNGKDFMAASNSLVTTSPAAVVDGKGRFPLHYACFNKSSTTLTGLIVACPEALRVPDPMTGLVPAQLVATRCDFTHQLNLGYQMIQACPEIVTLHQQRQRGM
ncbi:hypothetical protein ACA910_004244 [Epithemia clementina (nom. ined.)]